MTAAPPHMKATKLSAIPIEERLTDYIEQVGKSRKGRRAVRLHLSLLAAQHRRDQHIQAAVNTFQALVRMFDGAIFPIGNSDLILVFKGANVLKIDQAVQKVRFLFSEDALFARDPAEGDRRFCTWYDLEGEYDAFRRDAQNCVKAHKIQQATERKRTSASAQSASAAAFALPGAAADAGGMSFTDYGNVETLMATVDLAGMIRQQPICALTREDPPQRVFDEIFVSIAELQKTLAPNRNLAEDRWMFQRLTRTLDRRMLKTLTGSSTIAPAGSMSLNLNVATLLSPEFNVFDTGLRAGARGTIMLELNLLDIFSDIGAYVYARDLVQERDYRVCIDGLTHLTATFIDRAKMGADMVKIYWSPDIADDPAGTQAASLTQSVRAAGPARVVLCRCDDANAVRTGLDLGIAMFRGHHLDAMLQSGATIGSTA